MFPFTFGKDRLTEMINTGVADAKFYIDMGKGNSIHNFYEMAMRQQEEDHDISPAQAEIFKEQRRVKRAQREAKLAGETIEIWTETSPTTFEFKIEFIFKIIL